MNAKEFEIWTAQNGIETVEARNGFKIGQKVIYTNEFGVEFEREIIGFGSVPVLSGRCIYLNKDAYWFPVKPSELKAVK